MKLPKLVFLGCAATGLFAQQPETAVIEGQVVQAGTGQALRKAQVILRKAEGRSQAVAATTGADGRFRFEGVEPGRYRLSAERNGYVGQDYGQSKPGHTGTILTVNAGGHADDVVLKLEPFAVLSGRVVDEDGDPVPYVRIQALRRAWNSGRRELVPADGASTDDRGEYRMFGLPAGRYYISASAQPRRRPDVVDDAPDGYVPMYYPGVTDAGQAAPLDLRAGADFQNVDFRLARTRTVKLSGRILWNAAAGRTPRGIVVFAIPRDSAAALVAGPPRTQSVASETGAFQIAGVPPGSYVLTAFANEEGRRYYARQPVEAGATNVQGIQLTLQPGVELTGRVATEDGGDVNLASVRILVEPRGGWAMGSGGSGRVNAEGAFKIAGIAPGGYTVSVIGACGDCYAKSIRYAGTELAEKGFEIAAGDPPAALQIVLSGAGARVEGTVMTDKQQPVAAASVALVPDQARRGQKRFYSAANTDQAGRFTMAGIAPGSYKLFAWADIDPTAAEDPDFLRDFEDRGETVSVDERGRATVQLKLLPPVNQ